MNITKESTATTTPQFTQMTADKDALLRDALHYVTYAHKHEDQCGCQRCNLRARITAALAEKDEQPKEANLRCRRCGDSYVVEFKYSAPLPKGDE